MGAQRRHQIEETALGAAKASGRVEKQNSHHAATRSPARDACSARTHSAMICSATTRGSRRKIGPIIVAGRGR